MCRLPGVIGRPNRLLCLFVFFTFLPLTCFATEISGRVSVEGKGPIPNAQVTIYCPADQHGQLTDSNGLYRIAVSDSEVECVIQVNESDKVTFYASGRRTWVNLELRGNHLRRK